MLQPLLSGISRKAARHLCSKPFAMGNPAPLVSFTFDDVPDSAGRNGAAELEQRGIRGTFYIATGICGTYDDFWRVISRDQVQALHQRGHEIGCHTFSHINVERLDAAGMDEECRRNRAALHELCGGPAPTSFCYPFGRLSLPRKLQLMERFDNCRGVYQGLNVGTIDLALLRVIELYDRTLTPEKLERLLRETRDRNGWLIFYTHDVIDPPSWIGCSPALLGSTIDAVQAMGIECLPIRDAMNKIGYRQPAALQLP
jgi:peptidoglycan/xylan/chitin deacetylase (PgdA/CDA1 family)